MDDGNKRVLDHREEYIQVIRELTLMDNVFTEVAFDNNVPAVQEILDAVIPKACLHVTSVKTEYVIPGITSKGIRMDIHAFDSSGAICNVEIQRRDDGAAPRRARHNASVIDTSVLRKGCDALELPEVYIIFLTMNDVMKGNLPTYTVERRVEETGNPFGDGSHIVYVNGAWTGDDPVGRLVHNMCAKGLEDMTEGALKETVRKYKETEKGVHKMCEAIEKIRDEGRDEGRNEGREEGRIIMLKDLIADGILTVAMAAKKMGMSEEAFRKMAML